jgi:putative restriction endonuclease
VEITVDDVLHFAQENAGKQFLTIGDNANFKLAPRPAGGLYVWPDSNVRRSVLIAGLKKYVEDYNNRRSLLTTDYGADLHDKSYVLAIFRELLKQRGVFLDEGLDAGARSAKVAPRQWTRDELLIAMNLYGRLEFGQFHERNDEIVRVASKLGRTPGSVAMKLSNLASFDPALAARGIAGLKGASRLDREVWDAFHRNWENLSLESEARFDALVGESATSAELNKPADSIEWSGRGGATEAERTRKERIGQQIFRRMVLVSYSNRCCITGTPIHALLSASHIVPWAEDEKERMNPRNGLCLAKTQDAAFDRHLITLDEHLRVVISKSIRDHFGNESVRQNFAPHEGRQIEKPHRFLPDERFLETHRQRFVG